ncbi:hypothetical protein DGWBC_0879 [Dehalogenimonas sp. WBC-2]|nr:hypothetical protein DGWBC_0879 [Dehalogenimonas sp. WBC-2]
MVKGLFSAIAGPIWREDAFEKERITRRTMRQNTFGTIMVCVSKGGLPDDVHIISISKISREHNRPETEIIRELRKRGETLFTLKLFDVILGTLNEKLAKGTLHLPISVQQLLAVVAIPSKITVTLLPSAK